MTAADVAALTAQVDALREQVAEYQWIERAIEQSKATIRTALADPTAGDTLRAVVVDPHGRGGQIYVDDTLTVTLEGAQVPVLRWDLPLDRAEELRDTLAALNAGILTRRAGRRLTSRVARRHITRIRTWWAAEVDALDRAIHHLVTTGRAVRSDTGSLGVPNEEDPGL